MCNKKMCLSTILNWSFLLTIILNCARADQLDKNLSPINIITSKVTHLGVKPLTVGLKLFDIFSAATVTNTGTAIIFGGTTDFTRSPLFTGPLLNNEKYAIAYRQLYINQSLGRSGHEINGQGYPIEACNIFFNLKYATFEEARKQKDGTLILTQPVQVKGFVDNPLFVPFQKMLQSGAIREPYSTGFVSEASSFDWFDSFLVSRAFYRYEGSLYDSQTKKQISTAVNLITQPLFYNTISFPQFEAFKYVLDFKGKPLNVVAPVHPQGSRKINGTIGVNLEILPFGITIPLLI